MTTLSKLNVFLANFLQTNNLKDYGPTGLQVTGQSQIRKIALGTSANLAFFQKAVQHRCQAAIVHHGLFWEKEWPFTIDVLWKKRLQFLFEKNISIFAFHYPLDAHFEVGNNVQILKKLGCSIEQPFGSDEHFTWGYQGTFKQPIHFTELCKKSTRLFRQPGIVLPFGKKIVQTIGVISGGGSFALREAITKRLDVFFTGALKEPDQEIAREGTINVIAPGHYVTEQFGIKALGKIIEKELHVATVFLDVPTPL